MRLHRICIALLTGALCCVPSFAQDSAAGQPAKDKMFLKKAAAGGMYEVQAGQIAAQKGNTDAVKSFGQQMVTDHTKLNNDMAPIAQKLGVTPPAGVMKMQQANLDKLNSLSGAAFDNEYITQMVKAHRMDLHAFHLESMNAADPDLKTATANAEGVVHHHLEMIEKIAKDQNVEVPAHGGHATPPPAQ